MYSQPDPPLLRAARELAQGRQRKLDPLHVLLAALVRPDAAGRTWAILLRHIPAETRRTLSQQADALANTGGEPLSVLAAPNENTTRMDMVERFWTLDIQARGKPLTSVLVLRAVLLRDDRAIALMRGQQVALEDLIKDLTAVADLPDAPPGSDAANDLDAQFRAQERLQARERQAQQIYRDYIRKIDPTSGLPYARLMLPRLTAVFEMLAQSAAENRYEVPICVSVPGTVRDLLVKVMADRTALREAYQGQLEPLRAIRQVWCISLLAVLLGATLDPLIDPTLVLREAKRAAADAQALLIVEHVEVLTRWEPQLANETPPVQFGLRASDSGELVLDGPDAQERRRLAGKPSTEVRDTLLDEPVNLTLEDVYALTTEFARRRNPTPGLVLGFYDAVIDEAVVRETAPDATTTNSTTASTTAANAPAGTAPANNQNTIKAENLRKLLNRPSLRALVLEPSDQAETKNLIEGFYAPLWAQRGYTVRAEVFKLVYDLNAYIQVGGQRVFLPMVAIELASRAIDSADQGMAVVNALISNALLTLIKLGATDPPKKLGRWERFKNVLAKCWRLVTGESSSNAGSAPPRNPYQSAYNEVAALKVALTPKNKGSGRPPKPGASKGQDDAVNQYKVLREFRAGLLLAQLFAGDEYQVVPDPQAIQMYQSGEFKLRASAPSTPAASNGGGQQSGPQGQATGAVDPVPAPPPANRPDQPNQPGQPLPAPTTPGSIPRPGPGSTPSPAPPAGGTTVPDARQPDQQPGDPASNPASDPGRQQTASEQPTPPHLQRARKTRPLTIFQVAPWLTDYPPLPPLDGRHTHD